MLRSHSVTMVEIVFPDQTNHHEALLGGQAMRLMNKAAFVAASRHARSAVVAAYSERVDFKIPARNGDLIELNANVVATGRTSMTVAVDLFGEDLLTGERSLCARGRFVLVAVNGNGKPRAVPALSTDEQEPSRELSMSFTNAGSLGFSSMVRTSTEDCAGKLLDWTVTRFLKTT